MGERAELHDLAFSYMVERGPDIRKSSDSGIDARRSIIYFCDYPHDVLPLRVLHFMRGNRAELRDHWFSHIVERGPDNHKSVLSTNVRLYGMIHSRMWIHNITSGRSYDYCPPQAKKLGI